MTASIRPKIWIALATLTMSCAEANAQRTTAYAAPERAIAACIRRAGAGRGWLEKTLWALREQEGGWIGAEVPNSDGSHDLGPLQVNSWWVPRLAAVTGRPPHTVRRWLTHDACFNVDAARWIFLSGLAVTRDYWKAIGVYHSPTGWRQRRYAHSVARKLTRRFGTEAFANSTTRGSRSVASAASDR